MHVVYLIQHDKTHQIYIGRTNNLKRRLREHNSQQQTSTIRKDGQWVLIYAEAYRDKADADAREQKLKQHGTAKHKLKLRIVHSLLRNQN